MDIEIREMKADDYSVILSLWNNELGNRSITADNISTRFKRMNKDKNYRTFVAVFENKVVGFITVVQTIAMEYEIGYLKINGIAVKEHVQGKGIGTKLLKHAENYAFENGISRLILNNGFQRTKAHAFYESKGFDKLSYCFSKNINLR